ncbi:hypothetical protein M2162_007574 [Streptomyces sp. SAI-041]|nr:hypothetical protein [Streptomyces sp. SAI-041]
MTALADQMQVGLAERGQETVGVVHLLLAVRVRHQQGVVGDRVQGQQTAEEPVALRGQPSALAVDHDAHPAGEGAQGPEDDPARHRVGTQQGVRVVVGAGQQPAPVPGVERGGRGAVRRSGRLGQ